VRLNRAKNKQAFLKWGWIDLIACIPNLDVLRWGRLVRVLKVIRLLRAIRSVQRIVQIVFQDKKDSGASALGLTAVLLVFFSSVSILVVERHAEANIKTAEDAIWWSVSTITTVGYGDKYPVTTEGRFICMILMLAGVGMFASLSGLIASHFLGAREKTSLETMEMLDRLETLQAKIETLIQNQTENSQRNNTG
jgi:voltage-gated potassium channel